MLLVGENRKAELVTPPATTADTTPTTGQQLSCSLGTWSRYGTITYQWRRDGVNIAGATSSTYTLTGSDEGTEITCIVTNTSDTGAVTSVTTNQIQVSATPGGIPIVANQTLEFGKLTQAGYGGTYLVNTGDAITGEGGTNLLEGTNSGHFAIAADGRITPTSSFVASPQNSYSLTATVYGTSATPDTCTVTINCTGSSARTGENLDLTYHVSSSTEAFGSGPSAYNLINANKTFGSVRSVIMRDSVPGTFYTASQAGSDYKYHSYTAEVRWVSDTKYGAKFRRLLIRDTDNITWKDLEFVVDTAVDGTFGYIVLILSGSNTVKIEGCKIHSNPFSPTGDYSLVGPNTVSHGIFKDGSTPPDNVTITNCEVYDVGIGVNMGCSSNLTITGNYIHDVYDDCIKVQGFNGQDVTVSDNILEGIIASSNDVNNPHPDFLQFVGQYLTQDVTLTIERNVIIDTHARAGGQGIFIDNYTSPDNAYAPTVIVRGNIVYNGGSTAAIGLGQVKNAIIEYNTLINARNNTLKSQIVIEATGGKSINIGTHYVAKNICSNISVINGIQVDNLLTGANGATIPYSTIFDGVGGLYYNLTDPTDIINAFTMKASYASANYSDRDEPGASGLVTFPTTIPGSDGANNAAAPTPYLTTPTASATGATTANAGCDTSKGSGTLYWVASASATAPTITQIEAGQDGTGSVPSGSQAISGTGTQAISVTGLTTATSYYIHMSQRDARGNYSNIVTSSQITTS